MSFLCLSVSRRLALVEVMAIAVYVQLATLALVRVMMMMSSAGG